MARNFSEDSRVKIPALVHFTRLGYGYISVKKHSSEIDPATNIFKGIFCSALERINGRAFSSDEINRILRTLALKISAEDLGEAFYSCLMSGLDGVTLIDFEHPELNSFQVCTELTYKKDEDEFRPDVIVLINGMPLSFVEVKKPNNRDGVLVERARINARFKNKKFRSFANITQFMVFSNNMEYDSESLVPVQGAFYASPSYGDVSFNCFREEDAGIFSRISPIAESVENDILRDTNLVSIKGSPEYHTNLDSMTPTNKIITSLYSKERLMFLLRYGLAYVKTTNKEGIREVAKHIMRYPQLFASFALSAKLGEGTRKGVIWHTQGSGKTALAYYNVKVLSDYFQRRGQVAKFYFIVDRLDLLEQACGEFKKRGLKFIKVNSKADFVSNIGQVGSSDKTGENEINVVNIQKFSSESVSRKSDYNVNVQRVYFLDEAHRSYNPKGSFLANLISSDPDAVIIALTGTPLISSDYKTTEIFGNYIHTYYYNQSISDGYTLKLIREGISTEYRLMLRNTLAEIQTRKGSISREEAFARPEYVEQLAAFIVDDFAKFRFQYSREVGGMIICDSSQQAREIFKQIQLIKDPDDESRPRFSSALILHDEDDKSTRKSEVEAFKRGEVDLLVVYNMLLTGFDAPVLKRLYFGRVIRAHNLLQALTRVNRPYKDFRFGYVVDFADIREEFDKTNQEYFNELQKELGGDVEKYSEIFKRQDEIESEIREIENALFEFDTDNLEIFSRQVSEIDDKAGLLRLRKLLDTARELYNLIRLMGYEELSGRIDLARVQKMYAEVSHRIDAMNLKERLAFAEDVSSILDEAFDGIRFDFKREKPEELVIADKFYEIFERVRRALKKCRDKKDPEYISLLEQLSLIFQSRNFREGGEMSNSELLDNIALLEEMLKKANAQNQRDERLCRKYKDDDKFMRVHKHLLRAGADTPCFALAHDEVSLNKILLEIKEGADSILLSNSSLLENEAYFEREVQLLAKKAFKKFNLESNPEQIHCLRNCIAREYLAEV